jgi:hypothetical protein
MRSTWYLPDDPVLTSTIWVEFPASSGWRFAVIWAARLY